jgi:hypothetical protein
MFSWNWKKLLTDLLTVALPVLVGALAHALGVHQGGKAAGAGETKAPPAPDVPTGSEGP